MTLIRRTNPFGEMLSLRLVMRRLLNVPRVEQSKPSQIGLNANREQANTNEKQAQ